MTNAKRISNYQPHRIHYPIRSTHGDMARGGGSGTMSKYSVWLEGFGYDIENVSRNRALEVAEELLDEGFTVSEVRLYREKAAQ